MKALICGSFDPVTVGHMDIIKRSARLFDHVVVGVFFNTEKKYFFSAEERAEMISDACKEFELDNVTVDISNGMVAHYVRENNIDIIVKGVRNSQDFEYENMINNANKLIYPEAETLLMCSKPSLGAISSTVVREFIKHGESIEGLVPCSVINKLNKASNN